MSSSTRIVWPDAGAALAGIHLDQRARRRRMRGDGAGGIGIVGQHYDRGTALVQLGDLIELLRRDADRIQDVGDAVRGEIFGFRQGGDGDAAGLADQRQAGHVDRLRGLHVRAQRHAVPGQRPGHGGEILQQDAAVEHQ
jgi:hypothetical protein